MVARKAQIGRKAVEEVAEAVVPPILVLPFPMEEEEAVVEVVEPHPNSSDAQGVAAPC